MWTNPCPCMKLITSYLLFNCRRARLTGLLFSTLILEHNDQTTLPLCLIPLFLLAFSWSPLKSHFSLQSSLCNYSVSSYWSFSPSVNVLLKLLLPSSTSWLYFCMFCANAYLSQGIPTSIHIAWEPKGDNAQRYERPGSVLSSLNCSSKEDCLQK